MLTVRLRMALTILAAGGILGAVLTACSSYRSSGGGESGGTVSESRIDRAQETVKRFRVRDPSLSKFFENAPGYAVFPKITKGAAGIGAAHGEGGVVYERGAVVGFAEVTQVTIGAQLGGQDYAEIIFFQDEATLTRFKEGRMEFSANASAVGATSGAGRASDFREGVAVFTMPLGGLMFEASIGGQKFRYTPK